jgi:hypothetical protein
MAETNLSIITGAFRKTGIVDETESPSPAQAQDGLLLLNNYLLNQAADGLRLGWYPQSNLAAIAPLKDADIHGVKMLLAKQLAITYDITIKNPLIIQEIADAERMLTKRYVKYFESDLSELSRAQGSPWGGPGWA